MFKDIYIKNVIKLEIQRLFYEILKNSMERRFNICQIICTYLWLFQDRSNLIQDRLK